jgi:hypothetical protein
VLELAMAATLPDEVPAIVMKQPEQVPDFHNSPRTTSAPFAQDGNRKGFARNIDWPEIRGVGSFVS